MHNADWWLQHGVRQVDPEEFDTFNVGFPNSTISRR